MQDILADMISKQHAFDAEALHDKGVAGLEALLNELFPDTAPPAKLDAPEEAVAKLIEQLGDDNYRTREVAYTKLCEIGSGAEPLLVKAIGHHDAEIGWRARRILQRWNYSKWEDKGRYADAFAVYARGISDDARIELLLARTLQAMELGMPNGNRQRIIRECLTTIVRTDQDKWINQLRPLLEDQNTQIANLVVMSLNSGTDGSHIPTLFLEALKDNRDNVARQAIAYSAKFCNGPAKQTVQDALVAIYEGKNDELKFQVCQPLIQAFKYEPAKAFAMEQLTSGDRSRQYQALSWLADFRYSGKPIDPTLLENVKPLLTNTDNNLRRTAARTLGTYAGQEVVESLIPLLADKYASIPRDIQNAFPRQPDKKMVRRLLGDAAENHTDQSVRKAAEELLKRMPAS